MEPRTEGLWERQPKSPSGEALGKEPLRGQGMMIDSQRPVQSEGRKDDEGKLRFDLIPVRPLEAVAQVYTMGAGKYSDRNWENGMRWGRVFAAMMRHGWAWWRGERFDLKDGQHHLASVVWCAMALMEFESTHPELDERGGGERGMMKRGVERR